VPDGAVRFCRHCRPLIQWWAGSAIATGAP
jgi:hypothetical protein